MTLTLVRGKYVISKSLQGRLEAISHGAVLVRDGWIAEIGSSSDLSRKHPDAEAIGGSNYVVSPGFINAHHHVGVTPLQLGAPDLPLELWVARRIATRAVDPYLDTLYSAFEMVESGVTTVQHLHGRVPRPVDRVVESATEIIRAYQDIGMRVSYSFMVRDQNRLAYQDDDEFVQSLTEDLRPTAFEIIKEQSFSHGELVEIFETLFGQHNHKERVKIQVSPHNLQWCSDSAIHTMVGLARKYQVPIHMHLLETPIQKEYARRRANSTAVRHLHELGALGPDMTLGHGVWMTEEDIGLVAETGTCICHNCSSNLRLRSGVAPLNRLREYGVRVALGIDEAGLNDDRDMLQEMRLVLRLHRTPGLNEDEVPTCSQVFHMATEGGASTTPYGRQIGSLEVGKAADLVLFDWSNIEFPYLSPDVPVIDALIQRARAGAIALVMVAGEVIYEDGHFTRVDRKEVLEALCKWFQKPLSDAELRNREFGLRLVDPLRKFYSGYLDKENRKPFYQPSSRI